MKNTYFGFITAASIATLTMACGGQETQVIENFFLAVKAKDTQTVAAFSMAQFDQEAKSWNVKSVGEEQRVPAPLSALSKTLKDVDELAAQNKKDAGAYFNAHPLEVDKVKPMVESGGAVPANLQKTAADWKKFNDADKDLKAKAAEAKAAYERERRTMGMSMNPGSVNDALAGDLITRAATVEVEIGSGEKKTYTITIRKYEVAPPGKTVKIQSRWLIQSITPQ